MTPASPRRKPTRRHHSVIRLVTLAMLISVLCYWASPVVASPPLFQLGGQELDASQRPALRATVAIESLGLRPGTGAQRAEGSGFVVAIRPEGKLLIATAAHVVPAGSRLQVLWPGDDGEKTIRTSANRVWNRRSSDLALIETELPSSLVDRVQALEPAAEGIEQESRLGSETVLAVGFPSIDLLSEPDRKLSDRRVVRHAGGRLVASQAALQAEIEAFNSQARRGRLHLGPTLLHTAPILPGASGGPLLDAHGRVLGVHVGSLRSSDGTCVVDGASGRCLHLAASFSVMWPPVQEWTRSP